MLVAEMLGSLKVRCAAKPRALHCTELSERRRCCAGGLNELSIQIERLFQIERQECSRTSYESDVPLRTVLAPPTPEVVSYTR